MIQIGSASNEHFKRWRDLSSSKGIRKHGEFILMGEKLIEEFRHQTGDWKIHAEILTEGLTSLWPEHDRDPRTPKRYFLAKELFKEVDVMGTHFNLLVLEAPTWETADLSNPAQGLELVCPLGDPSNLGAIVRSAVAFDATALILTSESANPLHPKAVKASAGAVLRTKFLRGPSLKDYQASGESWALDMKGDSVGDLKWPDHFRLIVGEEGPGLPELPGVRRISVPTRGVESLNATVAASIALFDWKRQTFSRP